MRSARSTTARYALVLALAAALGVGGWVVADQVAEMREKPESLMGPGYNPPPPVIPVS